jgi:Protein phosphatase 2C
MTARWVAASASQIGSIHIRDGTPTQDAHRTWTGDGAAVIAVADGHGHSAHFRSAVGAELAAALALETLSRAALDMADPALAESVLRDSVGPNLVDQWNKGALKHIQETPFDPKEQQLLFGGTDLDLLRAYGSTVIAMVATADTLGVIQLGDGDAVVAFGDGDIVRPLPEDPDLDGNRTTSLCQADPLRSLRVRALDLRERPVSLAFIATDGFGAPRIDQSGWWMQTAIELVDLCARHGFGYISGKLPDWLDEPATYGGDDTTLALLCDQERLARRKDPTDQGS